MTHQCETVHVGVRLHKLTSVFSSFFTLYSVLTSMLIHKINFCSLDYIQYLRLNFEYDCFENFQKFQYRQNHYLTMQVGWHAKTLALKGHPYSLVQRISGKLFLLNLLRTRWIKFSQHFACADR